MINKRLIFFVIYHNHVSDRKRNFLKLLLARNDWEFSDTVLYSDFVFPVNPIPHSASGIFDLAIFKSTNCLEIPKVKHLKNILLKNEKPIVVDFFIMFSVAG